MKISAAFNQYWSGLCVGMLLLLLASCTKSDTLGETVMRSNLSEKIILDTAYGEDDLQKLDIYLPAGRTEATGLVVLLHGDAWHGGDKSNLNNFIKLFRAKWPDVAIANINYRDATGDSITYSELIADVEIAINMLAAGKSAFNISNNIALWGVSAGAHLALQYTYTKNDSGYVKCVADVYGPAIINDWDFYNITEPVKGKDLLWHLSGSRWNEELYKALSPIENVVAASKPTIIFHGNLDAVVPVYHSQRLKKKLDEAGVPNEYHEYTDFHGFNDINIDDCVNKSILFFKKHLK